MPKIENNKRKGENKSVSTLKGKQFNIFRFRIFTFDVDNKTLFVANA